MIRISLTICFYFQYGSDMVVIRSFRNMLLTSQSKWGTMTIFVGPCPNERTGMNISTKMWHGATQLVSNWVRKCWKHVTTSEIQCLGISNQLHDLYHSVAHLSTKPGFLVIYDQSSRDRIMEMIVCRMTGGPWWRKISCKGSPMHPLTKFRGHPSLRKAVRNDASFQSPGPLVLWKCYWPGLVFEACTKLWNPKIKHSVWTHDWFSSLEVCMKSTEVWIKIPYSHRFWWYLDHQSRILSPPKACCFCRGAGHLFRDFEHLEDWREQGRQTWALDTWCVLFLKDFP